MPTASDTLRDRSRHDSTKARCASRKAARRAKSTRLFLCLAFADSDHFSVGEY